MAFMSAYSLDKFIAKLRRDLDRSHMIRKNYRKARFRKAEARLEKRFRDNNEEEEKMQDYEEKTVNAEIIGKGRGISFGQNTRNDSTENGEFTLEITGEPRECFLMLVPGMFEDEPDKKMPMLLFPDGSSEIALDFETKEKGTWKKVNLLELM